MRKIVIKKEKTPYKMKGCSNFLTYFEVIQDVLGLIEMSQNVVIYRYLTRHCSWPILGALKTEQ